MKKMYNNLMKRIFMHSNFTDQIQSHHDSSEADVLQPSSSEEEKNDNIKKYKKEYQYKN